VGGAGSPAAGEVGVFTDVDSGSESLTSASKFVAGSVSAESVAAGTVPPIDCTLHAALLSIMKIRPTVTTKQLMDNVKLCFIFASLNEFNVSPNQLKPFFRL
jgi:hypothetical protein